MAVHKFPLLMKKNSSLQFASNEDDIDKLFGRCALPEKPIGPTKVSTEIAETWGTSCPKNFTKSVKFLKMEDEADKFLTGLPEEDD